MKNLCIEDCIHFSITTLCITQFGFRQQHSTSHALINITEDIRKTLDDGNIDCRVFVDLQKAFTVNRQKLLAKLNHYRICGVSNDWFKSYLIVVSVYINGCDSGLVAINCGVLKDWS